MSVTNLHPTTEVGSAPTGTPEVVLVTPELAAEMLTHNVGNYRKLTPRIVKQYASDMAAGKWDFNGQTITFDDQGNLNNGQHRLTAVVESGVPIWFVIVRGVKPESRVTVDTQYKRTIGQILNAEGEFNATVLGAALGALYRFKLGDEFKSQKTGSGASVRDLLEMLQNYPEVRSSVKIGKALGAQLRCPVGIMAALHFVLWEQCPDDADAFYASLTSGANLSEDSPIYLLRKAFERDQKEIRKLTARHRLALTIKAWNLWISGDTQKQLSWRPGGAKPEPFPEIAWPAGAE